MKIRTQAFGPQVLRCVVLTEHIVLRVTLSMASGKPKDVGARWGGVTGTAGHLGTSIRIVKSSVEVGGCVCSGGQSKMPLMGGLNNSSTGSHGSRGRKSKVTV